MPHPGGPLALTESARGVLRVLSTSSPITRPQLGERLAFSKPTMSAAIGELEAHGLVAARGVARGPSGRSAVTYGLGPAAGFVIGIDAGTTQLRAMATTLDRQVLAQAEQGRGDGDAEIDALASTLLSRIAGAGPLRAIAMAVPTIVSPSRGTARQRAFLDVAERLGDRLEAPVLLENNVNCAALAELHAGAATDCPSFVYLQVGVRIGLGIVIERRLFRGFHGAAGEVARLPFPWAADRTPRPEGVETYLGATSLMQRCARDWPADAGAPPRTAEELFARAAEPGPARRCVDRHAADIGRLVTAVVGILDPGLVVIGGGIGQNELLAQTVANVVAELAWPTPIRISRLTTWGTTLGTVHLAADSSLAHLTGDRRAPNG